MPNPPSPPDVAALRAVAKSRVPQAEWHQVDSCRASEGLPSVQVDNTLLAICPDARVARFVATFDPPTVLALLDLLEAIESDLAHALETNEVINTAHAYDIHRLEAAEGVAARLRKALGLLVDGIEVNMAEIQMSDLEQDNLCVLRARITKAQAALEPPHAD